MSDIVNLLRGKMDSEKRSKVNLLVKHTERERERDEQ